MEDTYGFHATGVTFRFREGQHVYCDKLECEGRVLRDEGWADTTIVVELINGPVAVAKVPHDGLMLLEA